PRQERATAGSKGRGPMFALRRGMAPLSALASAGVVAAFAVTGSRAEDSAAAQVAQRFPAGHEMFAPVSMSLFAGQQMNQQPVTDGGKNDRLPLSDTCSREDWPYVSQQCLVSVDSSPVRN